jgi:hypothetical protein
VFIDDLRGEDMNYRSLAICSIFLAAAGVSADDVEPISPVTIDAAKLAGANLPAEEKWMIPDDVLEGSHQLRGEEVIVIEREAYEAEYGALGED